MNLKNVVSLVNAEIKSYRMVGYGSRFRRFRENRLVTYALYVGACLLGTAAGWLVGGLYSTVVDPQLMTVILKGAANLLVSLPTFALLYGLTLTQMGQFQRMGVKVTVQPLYWYPVTWEEHTLASVIANLLGLPLAVTLFTTSAITVASASLGLVPIALLTIFALSVNVFVASATTEFSRVLQVRLAGAVTRAAGRAATWVRLLGFVVFLILFYAVYFSFYQQGNPLALFDIVAGGQRMLWFIPYLWPGIALSYFASGLGLEAALLSLTSIGFAYAMFQAAVWSNSRFGLYEMPAVRVSRGEYIPRAGMLGRLGFSPLEAALMRKDFKAFTRRQELMYIFIMPIVVLVVPLMSVIRTGGATPMPSGLYSFLFAYLAMLPGLIWVIMLGSMMLGMEGGSAWYVYSSPITARALVKAKYSFAVVFSLAVAIASSLVAGLIAAPSVRMAAVSLVEVLLLIFSVGMVSISFGIRGADFRELPRPRMIRPMWSLINGIVCILLALAVVSPLIPYAVNLLLRGMQAPVPISLPLPEAYLYAAVPISGVVASIVTYSFYKIALRNAERFLASAEA